MTKNFIIEQIKHYSKTHGEALFFDDQLLQQTANYQELEEASNALAHFLLEIFPNKEPILVNGNLDKQSLITFIACLKSGHPYVPTDAATPLDRLALIQKQASPCLVISTTPWQETSTKVILPKDFSKLLATYPKSSVSDKYWVSDEDLLYIIFTSGTTGMPKGVSITYNNLMSFTDWITTDFKIGQNKRFLCQAPFSFDLSVMTLYPALLSGGCLVRLEKSVTDNFPLLFKSLPTFNLNVWVSTPSFIEICLMDLHFSADNYPQLTHFLFCGEELPKKVAQKLLERFPKSYAFNTYGPTEATVAMTSVQITPEIIAKYERLPLGKVKADTQLLILAEKDQPQAKKVGEVLIVGPSVAAGYYKNSEKTNEVFTQSNGQKAYHTGDLGYIEDDFLFYQGRLDHQIKWHGYRMELGDIEHHLESLSNVRRACVVPKYQNGKVSQLIACLVLEEPQIETTAALTRQIKLDLAPRLMSYMIPQKYLFFESLPLTANGKIDRKQLANEVSPS